MERNPKPDLDEVFTVYGEDPEDVARALVTDDEEDESEDSTPQ
jgi:hypothetical protein